MEGGGCRTFQVGLEVAVGLATRPKKFVAGYQGPTKVVEAGLGAPALSEQNNTPAHKPHIRSSQGGFGGGEGGGGGGEGCNHGWVAVGLATPKNWRLPKKPPPPYPLLTTPSPPLPGPAVPATHNNRQTLILPHEAWHPHQGGPSRGATVKRSGCHHALTVGNVVGVVGVPRYVPWLGVAPSLQPVANSTRSASLKGPTVGCDCISCKVVRAGFQQ